jgi:hypothetical protein
MHVCTTPGPDLNTAKALKLRVGCCKIIAYEESRAAAVGGRRCYEWTFSSRRKDWVISSDVMEQSVMGRAPQPSDFKIGSRMGDDELRSSLAGLPGVEVVLNLLLSYSSQTRPLTFQDSFA